MKIVRGDEKVGSGYREVAVLDSKNPFATMNSIQTINVVFKGRLEEREKAKVHLIQSNEEGEKLLGKQSDEKKKILAKKEPLFARKNELAKEIDKIQRLMEKEDKKIRDIDSELNAYELSVRDAKLSLEKSIGKIRTLDDEIEQIKQEWKEAIRAARAAMVAFLITRAVNFFGMAKKNFGNDGSITYQLDYVYDKITDRWLGFFPCSPEVASRLQNGPEDNETNAAARYLWEILNYFKPEYKDIGFLGAQDICLMYIHNPKKRPWEIEDYTFFQSPSDKYENLFIMHKVPDELFEEFREIFF